MAKAPKIYSRLTRNTAGLGSYSSLWLAADHLLIVRSTGYHEDYSRVALRDIKAIFLVASERRFWWGIVWGILLVPSALALIMVASRGQAPIFSAFFFLFAVTGATWNHLLGPGCRALILTGVQTAELPPLVRFRKARLVLGDLEPLIESAQADLASAAGGTTPATAEPGATPASASETGGTPAAGTNPPAA